MMDHSSIMVVDDDEGICETLVDILEDTGYVVAAASTGGDALGKARESTFDIVLVDIVLPDMEGIALMKELRHLDPEVECIVITGHASLQNAVHAIEEGAAGYFTKPLMMEDVLQRLAGILERKQLRKERARSEVYGFLASALPVFAANVPVQARDVLVRAFAERFAQNMRPRFQQDLKRARSCPYPQNGDENSSRCGVTLGAYLAWLRELFASIGARAEFDCDPQHPAFSIHTCPWKEEALGNPVFCLICRAMVSRSFTWTDLRGRVSHQTSIAGGSGRCAFDISLIRGPGSAP